MCRSRQTLGPSKCRSRSLRCAPSCNRSRGPSVFAAGEPIVVREQVLRQRRRGLSVLRRPANRSLSSRSVALVVLPAQCPYRGKAWASETCSRGPGSAAPLSFGPLALRSTKARGSGRVSAGTFATKRRSSSLPWVTNLVQASASLRKQQEECSWFAGGWPLRRSGLTIPSSGHTTAGDDCSPRQHRRRRCVPLTSNVRPVEMQVPFTALRCCTQSLAWAARLRGRRTDRRSRAGASPTSSRAARPSAASGGRCVPLTSTLGTMKLLLVLLSLPVSLVACSAAPERVVVEFLIDQDGKCRVEGQVLPCKELGTAAAAKYGSEAIEALVRPHPYCDHQRVAQVLAGLQIARIAIVRIEEQPLPGFPPESTKSQSTPTK